MKPVLPPELRPATNFVRAFVSSITGGQRGVYVPTLSAHTVLTVFFTLQGVCAAVAALTMQLSWYVPQEGRYCVPYFFEGPLSSSRSAASRPSPGSSPRLPRSGGCPSARTTSSPDRPVQSSG